MFIMTIGYAVYNSWSIFYVAILKDFGWTRAGTAMIFSIASLVYGFGSAVAGALFDRFGPKKLFSAAAVVIAIGAVGCSRATQIWQFSLFFGILAGLGTCALGFIPNLALVSNWFERKRGTALGISTTGARDTFVLVPLFQLLILSLGWRRSYLVLAAATVVLVIPMAMLLRTRPQDMGLLPDGEAVRGREKEQKDHKRKRDMLIVNKEWASTKWTLLKAMSKYRFWTLFFLYFCGGIVFTALISHFIALIQDFGFTALFGAGLLTIYAICCVTGRLFGFLADLIGRERAYLLSILLMVLPVAILLVPRDASAHWLLYTFVIIFGLGSGLNTPVLSAAFADLFQGERFGTITGFANIGYGLGAAVGTWFFGYIYDVSKSYRFAIVLTILVLCLMGTAIWIAAPRKVRRFGAGGPETA